MILFGLSLSLSLYVYIHKDIRAYTHAPRHPYTDMLSLHHCYTQITFKRVTHAQIINTYDLKHIQIHKITCSTQIQKHIIPQLATEIRRGIHFIHTDSHTHTHTCIQIHVDIYIYIHTHTILSDSSSCKSIIYLIGLSNLIQSGCNSTFLQFNPI